MPTTALQDTFTDSDGTAVTAHTMNVGSGWTADNGAFSIFSNKAMPQSGVSNVTNSADAGQSDAVMTCNWDVPSLTSFAGGNVARLTDANNCWLCIGEYDGAN